MNVEIAAQTLAAIFTLASVVLSIFLVTSHLNSFTNPREQKYIIIIILMVPLFAVDSFIGLFEVKAAEWVVMLLDSIKECYEAVVLYAFIKLMFSLVQVDAQGRVPKRLENRPIHHSFPFTYIVGHEWHMSTATLHKLEMWTAQFILLRPLLSIISIATQLTGHYDAVYFYVSIILNISVTVAVYALMLFYHTFAEELSAYRPLAKFLCIKGVVFFSFWQGVVLEILVYMKIVHAGHWYSVEQVSVAIQNFLVCLEMGLLFSVAHLYAFTPEEYKKKKA